MQTQKIIDIPTMGSLFRECRLDNGKICNQLTTQQHVNTIANPHRTPAVPTTHVNRMNNITPKMFWMHGRKQPISVPGDERDSSEKKEKLKIENST
jgi:hypothetical protein